MDGDENETTANDKENQQSVKSSENKETTKRAAPRRKKKLVIDDVKEIDSVTMKAQLNDTSAIISTLELAPPTRKLMQLKESGSIDRLLMSTSRPLNCLRLQKLFTNNMVTRKIIEKPIVVASNNNKEENRQMENQIMEEKDMTMDEKQRNNNINTEKLPLADSFVDNDITKDSNLHSIQMNDMTIENNIINDTTLVQQPEELLENPPNISLAKEIDLDLVQPTLEVTPPHKHKSTRESTATGHRKSGVTNVTTFNTDLLIDELNNNENDGDSNKILNKRAKTMISLLNKSLTKQANIGFFELTKRNGRKQAAQKFYSLLILKKYDAIDVTQCESFGDIIITKSNKFDNFVSS